jgi:hypothetical protein
VVALRQPTTHHPGLHRFFQGQPMDTLAGYVDDLPSLCGHEPLVSEAIEVGRQRPVFAGRCGH